MDTIDVTYAQTQPRTVEGGLRPHLFKAGLRPEPGLEQLEGAEQIDSFGYLDCGGYLESLVRERTFKNIDQVICNRNTFKNFINETSIKIMSKIIRQLTQLRQHKRRNQLITSH